MTVKTSHINSSPGTVLEGTHLPIAEMLFAKLLADFS